jgi:YegS/Rv2252/BmrU family lipid kinase
MTRRILLIANPSAAAGRATARWEKLLGDLEARKLKVDYALTDRPRHAVELARDAADKYDVIAAVGGDGTVNEVASGLLLAGETNCLLGVVPVGTGNDAAKLVGISTVDDSVRALAEGTAQPMDVIEVVCEESGKRATRYALLYAAVGFAGELLKHTTPEVKKILGSRYCYTFGFFRALFTYETPVMRIQCDDREFNGRTFLVSAGNAEIVGAGTMRLSPGASVEDGKLNVNVVEELGRLEVACWFPRLLMGMHTTHPKVHYFAASSVSIECQPSSEVQVDGELFGQTPVTFTVKPKALRVITGWGLSVERTTE